MAFPPIGDDALEKDIYEQIKNIDMQKLNEEVGSNIPNPKKETIEAFREELHVLAAMGKTKKILGKDLAHEKIDSLKDEEIDKYVNRYRAFIGQKTADRLVDQGLSCSGKLSANTSNLMTKTFTRKN